MKKRKNVRRKSPFLLEKPTGTLPIRTNSPYTEDLFKRSDEAFKKLKKVFETKEYKNRI